MINKDNEVGYSTPKKDTEESESEESVASPEEKPKNPAGRKNKLSSNMHEYQKELMKSHKKNEEVSKTTVRKKNKQEEEEESKSEDTKKEETKNNIADRIRTRRSKLEMPEPEKQTKLTHSKGKRIPRKQSTESE